VIERQIQSLCELEEFNVNATIVATGPLTADPLAEYLRKLTGSNALYFYDAIAPIIDGDTIDYEVAFFANRKSRSADRTAEVDEGAHKEEIGHYLNLPLNREEYFNFVEELKKGEKVPFHNFEEPKFFNGCQPIEVLAESGPKTLSFGPMKPMGLDDPRTGRRPYAAVQLRREKLGDGAYNMVGFQTRLKWPEQKRIFRMLPGLSQAEFHRMGSMHRNTYMIAPEVLQSSDLAIINAPNVWIAGQLSGVEGYVESAAMGLLTAHIVGRKLTQSASLSLPPPDTALGCLVAHLRGTDPKHYCPMNIHWGLYSELSEEWLLKHEEVFPAIEIQRNKKKLDKSLKRSILALRSETLFADWLMKENL
jgi:methylenetetrahydrofolate--tRNA-(uracil-5-)-methyltransferase